MTWQGNPRTTTPAHRARRLRILARDGYTCYLCHQPGATECDHVTPLAEGGADTDTNCAAICHPCHATKSSAEGGRARARKHGTTTRTPEPHPGLAS